MLRYPLVCFDLDGTLVNDTIYIWKTLHETLHTDQTARKNASTDYFSGEISYREWFEHDLLLFKQAGATKNSLLDIIHTLSPMPGAKELLADLKQSGHILTIVSGSLDIVVDHLFGLELFDHVLINQIRFDHTGQIAGGTPTKYDLDGKADGLKELARREHIALSRTLFIGDNDNDIWIANAAGKAIAFNCKSDALRDVCDVEVTEKDLRAVRPHIY
ncbi:MAG: HAD-IB family phosphatase [Proteobacteria bacterium]|nr:HAD-IB family phosphatase [Pseudomonadota bacterium]